MIKTTTAIPWTQYGMLGSKRYNEDDHKCNYIYIYTKTNDNEI